MPNVDRVIVDTWNFSDPKASEAAFRKLAERAVEEGCPSDALQLQTQVARALGLQKRMEEATAALDRVHVSLGGAPAKVSVREQLERGRVLRSSGEPEGARPLFEAAFEQALGASLTDLAVDAAHMVAITYGKEPKRAIEWNERALELVESSDDELTQRWKGSLYNNLGWTYHDQKEFDKALQLFEKALEYRKKQGDEGPLRIARWSVARALRSLGRVEEALEIQKALFAEYEKTGKQSGFVLEEVGECYLSLGQPEEARPFFAQAYEALSKDAWLVEHEPERLERLAEHGGVR